MNTPYYNAMFNQQMQQQRYTITNQSIVNTDTYRRIKENEDRNSKKKKLKLLL